MSCKWGYFRFIAFMSQFIVGISRSLADHALNWIWLLVSSDVMLTLISSDFIFWVYEIAPDMLISLFSSFSSRFFTISSLITVASDPLSNNASTWRNNCVLFWIYWLLTCNWILFSGVSLFMELKNRRTAELLVMFYSKVVDVEVYDVSFGNL